MENLKLRSGSMAKPPLGIVPMRALVGVARVLEDGYVFYAPGNWAEQPLEDAAQAYDNGEQRHRMQSQPLNGLMTPQSLATLDADSGLPHIDHQIAGLIILRSLMIRDGVLPEDPGLGNRKRKAMQPEPDRTSAGIANELAKREQEGLRRMAEHIASRDYPSIVDPLQIALPTLAEIAAGASFVVDTNTEIKRCPECPGGDCVCMDSGYNADDERRAAADANIQAMQAEARQLAEEKKQRDQEVADRARARSEGMRW